MTWDQIRVIDWSGAAKPQSLVLSTSTLGCGCCSDGDLIYDKAKAMQVVQEHLVELEDEMAHWQDWLRRMRETDGWVE